jgi:hypothetical protein
MVLKQDNFGPKQQNPTDPCKDFWDASDRDEGVNVRIFDISGKPVIGQIFSQKL